MGRIAFDVASRGDVHFRPQGLRGGGEADTRGQGNDGGIVRYVVDVLACISRPNTTYFYAPGSGILPYALPSDVPCSHVALCSRWGWCFFHSFVTADVFLSLLVGCIGLGSSSAVGPTIVEEVASIFLDTLYKA
jgi:hypothetical protein